jgi:uncharacterized protein YkwD
MISTNFRQRNSGFGCVLIGLVGMELSVAGSLSMATPMQQMTHEFLTVGHTVSLIAQASSFSANSECYEDEEACLETVLELINLQRSRVGAPTVTRNPILEQSAQNAAEGQYSLGQPSHQDAQASIINLGYQMGGLI